MKSHSFLEVHSRARTMSWRIFAASLALSMLLSPVLSFAAIVLTGIIPPERELLSDPWLLVGALAFACANTALLYDSTAHASWRIWPLGVAMLAGAAAGFAFLWECWRKTRMAGEFSPSGLVWLELAALAAGWFAVLLALRWRRNQHRKSAQRQDVAEPIDRQ